MTFRWIPLALLQAGCRATEATDVLCTQVAVPAITVMVKDADTQAGLAAVARGAVTDGAYTDSLRGDGSAATMNAAYERAGTYAVEVRATGYQAFSATGIRVTKGPCHVTTQTVSASLQKLRN